MLAAADGRLLAELLTQDIEGAAIGEQVSWQAQYLAIKAAVEQFAVLVDVQLVQRFEG